MSEHFARILLPLDGSEIANQAIPVAVELAQRLEAKLVLLRVVADLPYEVGVRDIVPVVDFNNEKQQELVDHATRWLQRMVDDLALHKLHAQAVVELGDPAESILAYVSEEAVDLIVMSTHGRRGVPRLIHGSVAERVLAEAACPVMLVRPEMAKVGASPVQSEAIRAF